MLSPSSVGGKQCWQRQASARSSFWQQAVLAEQCWRAAALPPRYEHLIALDEIGDAFAYLKMIREAERFCPPFEKKSDMKA